MTHLAPIPHVRPGAWPEALGAGRFAAAIRRDTSDGCQVALLGLADDAGVRLNGGRPGAAHGPTALRAALSRHGAADPASGPLPRVFDAGDVVAAGSLDETHARVTEATRALLDRGLLPVAVGGGHDLTFPFVRAVAARWPGLAGLYFDAHLDVRDAPGSGMPFRRLIDDCGVRSLDLLGFRPLVNTAAHLAWFAEHGGTLRADDEAVRLPEGPALFASVDLDVLDAAHAPGVSAPNPAGLTVRALEPWVRRCGEDARVRCFDVMELCPPHDEGGRTARVAAHLVLAFLAGYARRGAP